MKNTLLKTIALSAVALLTVLSSCVKPPTPDPGKDGENEEEKEEVTETDVTKLKFLSFTISPEHNDRIYSEVALTTVNNTLSGEILYYRTDLSRLVASFETNAARVTIGGTEQQSGVTANDFTKPVTYRIHTPAGTYKEFKVTLRNHTYSGLPLLVLTTENAAPVTSKEIWTKGAMRIDKQDDSHEEISGVLEIKGRGNNSWSKDKKPYALKLADKLPLLGMNKHKRWALLANQSDKTLLRNKVAFEIAKQTGLAWTPDSRYVNVILNGRFLGNYLLTEQIKIDAKRVNVAEMDPAATSGDAITGGYLLEIDRYFDEVNKFRSAIADLPVNVKEPDEEGLNPAQLTYISNYFNGVESLLYAPDFPAAGTYTDLIDVDSFIDWWIVQELAHNTDSRLPGSCYMHKDRLGKLTAGPVWDFDIATFIESSKFILINQDGDNMSWFPVLFNDPAFRQRAKTRWQALKPALDRIPAFIDTQAAYLDKAAWTNWNQWEYEIIRADVNHDEKLPWNAAIDQLKKNYLNRLTWMDTQISGW